MYSLDTILVTLDLTEMDEVLIRYAHGIASLMKSQKVYFMHIAKDLELPESLKKEYPQLSSPLDEQIKQDIQSQVEGVFNDLEGCEVQVEIHEGSPIQKILHWAHIKNVDLVVAGRKNEEYQGSGLLMRKLAKKAHCSVMIVPPKPPLDINTVLVPVDFSHTSGMALEQAISIAEKTECEIVCQNAYQVPSGYHTSGKSFKEFAQIMQGHAEKDMDKFLSKFDLKGQAVQKVFTLDDDRDASDKIDLVAHRLGADLIIMGSKGRTNAASIFLGSIAEKLTIRDKDIPVLIVKDKEETFGFVEALLNL